MTASLGRKALSFGLCLSLATCSSSKTKKATPRDQGSRGQDASVVSDAQTTDAAAADAQPKRDIGPNDFSDASTGGTDADAGPPVNYRPKSLVLALDGIRPDAFAFANTPNYDALINGTWHAGYQGAYSENAQNLYDAPTVSGPNHSAIMTGVNAAQHGVTSNGNVGAGQFDTYQHYLRLIEASKPELNTVYLYTWGTDAEIVSGADYVKDSNDEGNVDRAVQILSQQFSDANGDRNSQWASGTSPDAIFLFLDDTDGAGHSSGFEIKVSRYIQAIEKSDEYLGRLLVALKARPSFATEDWQIVMTSDHGGYKLSHSASSAAEHTVPFLVSSRQVNQGLLPKETSIIDVVPTVLAHLDLPKPSYLSGLARGAVLRTTNTKSIKKDLVRYHRFEGNLMDSASGQTAVVGTESDHDPVVQSSGGIFGGHLQIRDQGGGTNNASYLTLPAGADIDFGDNDNLTVSLWFRSRGTQGGDPVIIGNKDWNSGGNPGWLLLANEGDDNSFGANYASTRSDRIDLEDIDYEDRDWWLLVSVFDAQGLATLYAGQRNGGLRWISLKAEQVGNLQARLPLNLGQDGTGRYAHNLDGDIDELAIWRRALDHQEVLTLFNQGAGTEIQALP